MMCSLLIKANNPLFNQQRFAINIGRSLHFGVPFNAARKGTREKARKKKVKVDVQKVGFVPHNLRNTQHGDKHCNDSWKQIATDDCYIRKYYRWPLYTIAEAITGHRETHHSTIYNEPHANVVVNIELDMQSEKSTRYLDNFQRMAMIPHQFDHGEQRSILVFTKGDEETNEARQAGATLVGGTELIKAIINSEIVLSEYPYIIAHSNILPELATLRGLMKRRFPMFKTQTLGTNLSEMIQRFAYGINYKAIKDEYRKEFGVVTANIGKLNMPIQYIEENLKSLLLDVNSIRPKREGRFITRVLIKSPPSIEQFKIDASSYIPEY